MQIRMGNEKINLLKFKVENNIGYDLKDDFEKLIKIPKELQEIDLSKDFTEINRSHLFHKKIVELMGILRGLGIAFENLTDFH